MFFLGLICHSVSKIPKDVIASYFILRCDLYCVSLKSSVYSDKTDKDWKGFLLSADVTDNFVVKYDLELQRLSQTL